MKKCFMAFLSIMLIFVMFSSCNKITDETLQDQVSEETNLLSGESLTDNKITDETLQDQGTEETNLLPGESLTDDKITDETLQDQGTEKTYFLPGEYLYTDTEAVPCIERYAFSSIEDFEFFCTTGSRDTTQYHAPPQYNAFPPYNMLEGCFVDITQLFPGLDKNRVTINYIEISSSREYSYSGYTNIGETPFFISIRYKNKSSEVTVADVAAAANAYYDQVILADYCETKNTASSSKGFTAYIFELGKCIIRYGVHKEKIEGMKIYCGDCVIGLSIGYPDNDAFFTDETLTSMSCLFRDGEDRVEALNIISNFATSH